MAVHYKEKHTISPTDICAVYVSNLLAIIGRKSEYVYYRKGKRTKKTEDIRMRNYNEVFGYETFAGFMTAAQLKRRTECIKEYKGYSIAFGKYQKDTEGRVWWSVRVWKNDGKDRFGAFTMKGLCATDGDAMYMATKWARANIDRIAG